jgi:hypothetical protein
MPPSTSIVRLPPHGTFLVGPRGSAPPFREIGGGGRRPASCPARDRDNTAATAEHIPQAWHSIPVVRRRSRPRMPKKRARAIAGEQSRRAHQPQIATRAERGGKHTRWSLWSSAAGTVAPNTDVGTKHGAPSHAPTPRPPLWRAPRLDGSRRTSVCTSASES